MVSTELIESGLVNTSSGVVDETTLVLPEIPSNRYWVVTTGALGIDWIDLRERRRFFDKSISKLPLSFRYSDTREIIPPAIAIKLGAERIMEEINGSTAWEQYYGEYAKVRSIPS